MKPTLVLGASVNPERYANKAIFMLKQKGHEVFAVGNKMGSAHGIEIHKEIKINSADTITLYLGKSNQVPYYDAILKLNPRRIIFNPGTKNDELERLAIYNNIEVLHACTLVLLSIGEY